MDAGDAILVASALSVIGTLAVTFAIGWFRANRRVRDLERQLSGAVPDTTLAQLEANLAAVADHVEQLATGPRFSFSSRYGTPAAARPAVCAEGGNSSITPSRLTGACSCRARPSREHVAFVPLASTVLGAGRMGRPRSLRPQLRRDPLGGAAGPLPGRAESLPQAPRRHDFNGRVRYSQEHSVACHEDVRTAGRRLS